MDLCWPREFNADDQTMRQGLEKSLPRGIIGAFLGFGSSIAMCMFGSPSHHAREAEAHEAHAAAESCGGVPSLLAFVAWEPRLSSGNMRNG